MKQCDLEIHQTTRRLERTKEAFFAFPICPGSLAYLARERDEAEVRGLDTRAAEHVRGRLRLRGGVLAHRKEVRLEEGPEQSAERSGGKLAWAGAREFAEAGIPYPSSSSASSPSPCSCHTHIPLCGRRALRVEAALEEVPGVVGSERRDGLLDARLLLRAQALALRPLRSLQACK